MAVRARLSLLLLRSALLCAACHLNAIAAGCPSNRIRTSNFDVTWNVPTHLCTRSGVELHPEKFGIRTNANQTNFGDVTAIFFNLGKFPTISDNGLWQYGGVPQNGNLTEHLEAVENDINTSIPDVNFQGLGIIDFEAWRPVWAMTAGSQIIYRNASIELVKQAHPEWNDSAVAREARTDFEQAGRSYMILTMDLCQRLRPQSKWGYYGYPMVDNYDMGRYNVSNNYMEGNNKLKGLYGNSTVLYPSTYVFKANLTSEDRMQQVSGRMYETLRVLGKRSTPVYPYFWYSYHDVSEYLSHDDLVGIIGTIYEFDMTGMVIWGGTGEVDTAEKCQRLYDYLETELGPVIQSFNKC